MNQDNYSVGLKAARKAVEVLRDTESKNTLGKLRNDRMTERIYREHIRGTWLFDQLIKEANEKNL